MAVSLFLFEIMLISLLLIYKVSSMNTGQKLEKLKSFKNEKEFREFLIDFLKKRGFTNVMHTHRYGSPEQGKDIIAKYPHSLEGEDWYAFVVKYGRIGGGTNEIETIKNQIKQSFEYPYEGPNGSKLKINKVKVVTNENFTGGAQSQISGSPELKIYNNFDFWWNENLIEYIDQYYSDFWLPGDAFIKEYTKNFTNKLKSELEVRELSLRIDDKKAQKLLDIFIEPKLTISQVEEDPSTKEKNLKNRKVSISSLSRVEENILLSGDQGSGKTKVLNNVACNIATPEIVFETGKIPVKLKAPAIKDADFDIARLVLNEVQELSNVFFRNDILADYTPILFIDDFDLLTTNDKVTLTDKLKEFCQSNDTNYVITYRRSEFDYDSEIKTIRIHNFNINQIESFVSKYFEGTEKGEKFIRVLRDSDLLSKLPTTPLTITLISLLFDENNFEIPATLSDIYTDFVGVLLGKLEVRNRAELLIFNIKRRLFSALALKMLDEKTFELDFENFRDFINGFLKDRDYQIQTDEELKEIISNSGILYLDEKNVVGFKQQAFVEFLASVEIYHHSREKYYNKLIEYFNDVNWQNTAIFYAGHSKELEGMIDDVISKSPQNDLRDWFITSGGMGYLAQALYQTRPSERKKLIIRAIDNLLKSFSEIKSITGDKDSVFYNIPMPVICGMINFWFNENFKSITLRSTLINAFEEIENSNPDSDTKEFDNNFRLLMIASTLLNPYIGEEDYFLRLLERKSFMNHPLLPLVADMILEIGLIDKSKIDKESRKAIIDKIKKKRDYIKAVLKEPAYRFNDNFALEEEEKK